MIIFDVLDWCYQTRQRGGMSWYCNFSLVFQCETVLSLIFSENTDIDSLGDLKKALILKLKMKGFCRSPKASISVFLENIKERTVSH